MVSTLPEEERPGVREPGARVDFVGKARDPARGVRRMQDHGDVGDEPTIRAGLSGDGDDGTRRGSVDGNRDGTHRLRESREIRRKIFDEMLAVGEDERAGVGGPVSSVDPVGDAIDAAQGVRGAQGYGHIGDEPSIRSRRPGDRGGRGGRSHVDVHRLRPDRFGKARDVRRIIFDEMWTLAKGNRAGIVEPVEAIDSVGDAADPAGRVRPADVYHPDEPAVPIRNARESSTIPRIVPLTTENSFAASTLPARSKEK